MNRFLTAMVGWLALVVSPALAETTQWRFTDSPSQSRGVILNGFGALDAMYVGNNWTVTDLRCYGSQSHRTRLTGAMFYTSFPIADVNIRTSSNHTRQPQDGTGILSFGATLGPYSYSFPSTALSYTQVMKTWPATMREVYRSQVNYAFDVFQVPVTVFAVATVSVTAYAQLGRYPSLLGSTTQGWVNCATSGYASGSVYIENSQYKAGIQVAVDPLRRSLVNSQYRFWGALNDQYVSYRSELTLGQNFRAFASGVKKTLPGGIWTEFSTPIVDLLRPAQTSTVLSGGPG